MNLTSDQLIDYIKGTLQVKSAIDADSKLFSTGELDSMSMMQLIAFIENAVGIEVRPDDVTLDNFDTVANILRFASAKA